jgi:hypothetical protein
MYQELSEVWIMAYTTIDDPSAYFQTTIYTGSGSDNTAITNVGNSDLQPDFIWIKKRSASGQHVLSDTSRGIVKVLNTNSTAAEDSNSEGEMVKSVQSDGFTLGDSQAGQGDTNFTSGGTYVAWQWKANGGTTTTNDASATSIGDTDSVYQVNSTAKFSIVTWTGSGSGTVSIAHGLGSTPKFIIIKQRDGANSWLVYHHKNTVVDDPHDTFLKLHLGNASSADQNNYFMANTAPTSTVATFGSGTEANASGTYIGYFFDEVQGYSKFGTYKGNGSSTVTQGPFIYTGFKPAWTMIKRVDAANDGWYIHDSTRSPNNVINTAFRANTNSAESGENIDFLSNGFAIRIGANNNFNNASGTYLYMAFAESPFVSSKGVPTTAR